MRINLVEDNEAQNDFGYKEIKQYHIFVKKSVYKKMLIQEMKRPMNWLNMLLTWVILISRFVGKVLEKSFFITLLLIFVWAGLNSYYGTPIFFQGTALTHDNVESFLQLYIQVAILTAILSIALNAKKIHKNEVFDNVFSRNVFFRLHDQALALEHNKETQNKK